MVKGNGTRRKFGGKYYTESMVRYNMRDAMVKGKGTRRKFGGKYYTESKVRYNMRDATETAQRIRQSGRLARITKEGKLYVIWERGKR